MTKSNKSIVIHIEFEVAKVTLEIPRILLVNYYNKIMDIENSIKVKMVREHDGLSNKDMVVHQVTKLGELQYDAHDRIFNCVKLGHSYQDITTLDHYLQQGIDCWMDALKEKKKEPREIHVKEIMRARANPEVTILA